MEIPVNDYATWKSKVTGNVSIDSWNDMSGFFHAVAAGLIPGTFYHMTLDTGKPATWTSDYPLASPSQTLT
jgi:hypothetical protein